MAKQRISYRTLEIGIGTDRLVQLRSAGISVPRAMVLAVVRDASEKYGNAFIGEVHAMYSSKAKSIGGIDRKGYSYNGVSSMLRTLYADGLVDKRRDRGAVKYHTTKKGSDLLDALGI